MTTARILVSRLKPISFRCSWIVISKTQPVQPQYSSQRSMALLREAQPKEGTS